MDKNNDTVATEVLKLLKTEYSKQIKGLYILLIIIMFLFVVSIVDSIYQRCRIIKVIEEYDKHCTQEFAEHHHE